MKFVCTLLDGDQSPGRECLREGRLRISAVTQMIVGDTQVNFSSNVIVT